MKKKLLLAVAVIAMLYTQAQYNVIYENSFRNWQPGQGWVIINNDTISQPAGLIDRSIIAGVPVSTLETLDNELGLIGDSYWVFTPTSRPGDCDKIMISPPLNLGANPHALFYSQHKTGSSFTAWVVTNPNDTTLGGLTTQVLSCNENGFNHINLNNWVNSTIRLAFRLTGINTYGLIDDIKVFNKTSLATIPDSCFRAYLQTKVPAAFIGNDLDYLHPSVLNTTDLICPNSCIKSLEGIQHFPFLQNINFNNNLINYIPAITFPYLDSIKAGNNLIASGPNMPVARTVILTNNLMKKIPNIFNQYADSFQMKNNSLYDCLPGTNRYARANFAGNASVNFGGFVYYYMTYTGSYNQSRTDPGTCTYEFGSLGGTVYYDYNLNGVYDSSDFIVPDQRIFYYQGDYIYNNIMGTYRADADTGLVNMNVVDLPAYYTCTNPLNTHLDADQSITHDFRLIATSSVDDLGVHLTSSGPAPTGSLLSLNIAVRNYGTTPNTGVAKIYLPQGYTMFDAGQGTVVNDTVYWPVTVNPLNTVNNSIVIQANYPTLSTVVFKAEVIGNTDNLAANNKDSCTVLMDGHPHDPNSKTVNTPQVAPGFSDYLYYAINFENTGTANATRVKVREYLSHKFDFSTFEVVGSTHPCTIVWAHDSMPEFVFYPVILTPNSVDSIHSRGSVWFRIKPLHAMQADEYIANTAAIYFDAEDPVLTDVCLVWAGDLHADFTVADTIQCGSYNITYHDISPGTNQLRQWTFTGGTPATSTAQNPQVHYTASGTYPVTLIIGTDDYTDTITKSVHVVVSTAAVATIIASDTTSFCLGDSVVLTATAATGVTYHWSFYPDTSIARTVTAYKQGYYNVVVTDALGCTASDYKYVTVYNPVPVISNTASCTAATAHLVLNTTYSAYLWSTGATVNTVNVNQYGLYNVRVTDSHGCMGNDTFNFVYHPVPAVNILGDSLSCQYTPTILHVADSFVVYLWSTGVSATSISVTNAGSYSLTVTDTNGCVAKDTFVHSIKPSPFSAVDGQRNICRGQTSTLQVSNPFPSYRWATGDTSRSITVSEPGTYEVTITNANGCVATTGFTLAVRDKYDLQINALAEDICAGQNIDLTSVYNLGNLTAPAAGCTTQTDTIGTGTAPQSGTPTSTPNLFSNYSKSTRQQILYKATELQAVLGGPKLITQIAFEIASFNSNAALQNFTIKMGSKTSPDWSVWSEDLVEVYYNSSFIPSASWNVFTLSTPVYWDGVSDLVVNICHYNPVTQGNQCNKARCTNTYPAFTSVAYAAGNTDQCGTAGVQYGMYERPNIRLTCCTPLTTPVPVYTPTYSWTSFGGNSTITNPAAANTTATADSLVTFVLTVSDTFGCSESASVTVNGSQSAGSVSLSAAQSTLCVGDSTQICATSGFSSYLWNNGATGQCIIASDSGNYRVTVSNGNVCPVISSPVLISYFNTPNPVISVNGVSLSTTTAVSYQWHLNDTVIAGAVAANYQAQQSGNYTVEITDVNGCHLFSNTVNLDLTSTPHLANVQSLKIDMYPNPFSDEITWVINAPNLKTSAVLSIRNVIGQEIYRFEETNVTSHYEKKLSLNHLPSGVYFMQTDLKGNKVVKRMVKE